MTLKRYIGLLTALVSAVLVVVIVQTFFLTTVVMTTDEEEPAVYAGDHLLVNRCSYGCRMPMMGLWGFHRVGQGVARLGEWLVFNNPIGKNTVVSGNEILVAPCVGSAGGSVYIDSTTHKRTWKGSFNAYEVLLPAAGREVKFTMKNANYLCLLMSSYEGCDVVMHSGKVLLRGREIPSYRFVQNYYAVSLAGKVLVVPEKYLIGRAMAVVYSCDRKLPWYQPFRRGRFMLRLGGTGVGAASQHSKTNLQEMRK